MTFSLAKARKGFNVIAAIGLAILVLILLTLLILTILVCLGVLTEGVIPIVIAVLAGVSLLIASFVGIYKVTMIVVDWIKSCCCFNFSKEPDINGNLLKDGDFLDARKSAENTMLPTVSSSSDEDEGELTKGQLQANTLANKNVSTPVKKLIIEQGGEFNYYSLYAVRKKKAKKNGKEKDNEEIKSEVIQEVIPEVSSVTTTPIKEK